MSVVKKRWVLFTEDTTEDFLPTYFFSGGVLPLPFLCGTKFEKKSLKKVFVKFYVKKPFFVWGGVF